MSTKSNWITFLGTHIINSRLIMGLHIIQIHGMNAYSAVMVTGNKLYPKFVYILAVFDGNGFIVSFFDQCFFGKSSKEHESNFITLEYRHCPFRTKLNLFTDQNIYCFNKINLISAVIF